MCTARHHDPLALPRTTPYMVRMTPVAHIVAIPVRLYRLLLSPWVGRSCRYQPTCSAYALDALEKHGAFKGSYLAARRIGRCHPFGGSGFDPVPEPVKKGEKQ